MGADSKRAKVVKLFNGFRASICKALLREHLNSELMSWRTMVREAEYQEMAENVETQETSHGNNHGSNVPNEQHTGQSCGDKASSSSQQKAHYPTKSPSNANTGNAKNNGSGKKPVPHDNHVRNGLSKRTSESSRPLSKEEREELKTAGKCFICHRVGHFSQNCPDKSRGTFSRNKPPGISAGSIRFGDEYNLEHTEQLCVDCLGETTMSLSIEMAGLSLDNQYLDDIVYHWQSECPGKEYDSDGDIIPDLQSVSDSSCSEDELQVQDYLTSEVSARSDESDQEDEEPEKEVLLAPPQAFEQAYSFPIEDGEEKLYLIKAEERPRQRLGQAVAQKAEDLLESMQPYLGDPANVLQF